VLLEFLFCHQNSIISSSSCLTSSFWTAVRTTIPSKHNTHFAICELIVMEVELRWARPSAVGPAPTLMSELSNIQVADRKPSRSRSVSSQRFLSGFLAPAMDLPMPRTSFLFSWIAIVVMHVLCFTFLTATTCVYWYLANPEMTYFVHLWNPSTNNSNYFFYGASFGLVGLLHAGRAAQLFHHSVQARRLVFRRRKSRGMKPPATTHFGSSLLHYPRRLTAFVSEGQLRKLNGWSRTSRRVWRALFSKRGLFGVESKHFFTIFELKEFTEVTTQTYQAYQSSCLLPAPWLNNFMVGMLVANCWSTLAVGQFLARRPALERVVALSSDASICIVMSIVIPSTILAPLAASFDVSVFMFTNPDVVYDPEFMSSGILKNQLVFASGLVDLSTKILPHLTIFLSLVTVSELLAVRPDPVESAGVPPTKATISLPAQPTSPRGCMRWVHTLIKVIFCAWGALVLGLHLHATKTAESNPVPDCRASTRPWLSSRASCSSLVVDCHALNVSSPGEEHLEQLTSSALTTITFSHCPALRMPSALQAFTNLMYLYLYNSTVVEWDGAGSVSASAHSILFTIAVTRTQFPSGFPKGLLHGLPRSVISIQFCVTDLASLPDDLHLRWHPLGAVAFEYSDLADLPASLLSLQTASLSLKANRFKNVSTFAAMAPNLVVSLLLLDDNPLTELSDALGSPSDFFVQLDLEGTLVASLPAWTTTQVGQLYMVGTPYCANTAPENRQHNVRCDAETNGLHNVEFPLEMIDKLYTIGR
jgi:hypothetical protein